MKKSLKTILFAGACLCQSAYGMEAIERDFITPPDSVQSSVYWYWISDNISREGVIKDLQSMKSVGINRAFIGNIGLSPQEASYGNVKLFSDEWWEIMHTALKTATELNIEIGLFNSPGWSQSGGPWIKPEQSMRYLASSELRVKGPQKLVQKLEQPTERFQDVKVIAYPVPDNYEENLFERKDATVTVSDGKTADGTFVGVSWPAPLTARSLVIYPAENIHSDCELQVKEETGFRTVKTFVINRTNAALNVGFEPYAPIAVAFPETAASEFRIVFKNERANVKSLRFVLSSTPKVESFSEKTLAKMFQSPLPYWHDYMWPQQPKTDKALAVAAKTVVDISAHMASDGTLTWDVPAGEWMIVRTGMAPTRVTNAPASPEGTGLEVDKMNKTHVAAHFNAFLGEIIKRVPEADRKSWKVVVEDSYETGGQNITDDFLREFRDRYGYDPLPWLPVFKGHVVEDADRSDRFLWDLRRMVADKVSYDYVGGLREISNRHGLTTWLENYGHWGFPGEFLQYGGQSDEIGGEFWSEGNLGDIENRAASSCAHIYGKTKVSAESFTCAGDPFSRYPATMKRRGDWSFTEGVNNTLLHVYIQQAYEDRMPGINAWFGNEFNRKNTWFSHMDLFVAYLKRSNFMLQQGLNVADVAYYIGEDAPKMTGVRDPELPRGYSFDYINAEVIVRDLDVKDGRLVLPHGTLYRLLVLPKQDSMRPDVMQKIEALVAKGAVILGPPPTRSPSMQNYPEADRQVQKTAEKLWGRDVTVKASLYGEGTANRTGLPDAAVKVRSYGKGKVLNHMNLSEAFDLLGLVPDCQFAPNDPALYVHRKVNDSDIYFISNQSDRTIAITPEFRVQGKQPELWQAVDGSIRKLPAFVQNGKITAVPLQLQAFESAFIVFREAGKAVASDVKANFPEYKTVVTLDAPWKVQFESDSVKRGPAEPVLFNALQDWKEHADERIRYYSGTAVYSTSFDLADKAEALFLDLGKVSVMAKVKINGQYAGGVWTAPYRLDVTQYVKTGSNTVEIEVVNTWVNRLIGDKKLPENERPTRVNHNPWNADSPLQSSGLLGPVLLSTPE